MTITTTDNWWNRAGQLGVIVLVVLCSIALAAGPAMAADSNGESSPSMLIELETDGSATVTMTSTYELADDEEREAFDSLREDAEAREAAADRFAERLQSVADASGDRVDRSMTVTDVSVEVSVTADGSVGVVTYQAHWSGLAAVDDDRLIVTEPFASGYTPDRPVTVVAPDGGEITSVTPTPDEQAADTVHWAGGQDLGGFEVVVTLESDTTGEDDHDDADDGASAMPGFGFLHAGIVVAIVTLLAVGRQMR